MTQFAIRYRPDTDLGRRFTAHGGTFPTRADAEAILRICVNAEAMEVIEVDE